MTHLQGLPVPLVQGLTEVLRLSARLVLLMLIFVPLERLFPLHPRNVFRKAFLVDLGYYTLNGLVTGMVLAVPTAFLAWGLHRIEPGWLQEWAAGLPLWGRAVAALLVGELGFYWGHRWTHEVPLLWRFHAVHHSAEEMDWLVNTRAHPVDMIFVRLCGFLPMYALGLAQPMKGATLDAVPLFVLLVGTLWGYFIHANLRWRLGWMGLLLSTPAFHHWHHTNDEHVNKNYASMLPWMDLLFGTWYLPKREWPSKYGTDTAVGDGLAAQLAQPFLGRGEKLGEDCAAVRTGVRASTP